VRLGKWRVIGAEAAGRKRAITRFDLWHFAKEAKERQVEHGGTAPGREKSTSGNITGSASPQLVETLPQADKGKARDKAAVQVGVSGI
jgi:hypothetical protein